MLNELVPDLEICEEAKEKGVEIESEFCWVLFDKDGEKGWRVSDFKINPVLCEEIIPAPLTDEILKVLPSYITVDEVDYALRISKTEEDKFFAFYMGDNEIVFHPYACINKKLSNALLLLAMKLKAEGII